MSNDPKYTDEQLDHQRETFREAAREPYHKTYIPVENAGQVADMLDDLKERREKGSSLSPAIRDLVQEMVDDAIRATVAHFMIHGFPRGIGAEPPPDDLFGEDLSEVLDRARRPAKATAKYARSADVNAAMQDIFPDSRFNDPADV